MTLLPLRATRAPAVRRTTAGPPALRLAGRVVTPSRLATGRAGVGAVMLVRPHLLPTLLGVDSATSARMGWAVQMLGARELALGLGTRVALRRGDGRAARLWLASGLLSDAVDAVVLTAAVARGRLSTRTGALVAVVAAGATALEAAELADEPAP